VVLVLLLQPAVPQEHDWQHSYIANHVAPHTGTGSAEPGYATFAAKPRSAEPASHAAPAGAASPVPLPLRHRRLPAALHEAGLSALPARRLLVAGTAGATAAAAADLVAQQLEAAAGGTAGGCPSVHALLSGPGCTCTVYYPTARTGDNSGSNDRVQVNLCPAGYRCSPTAAAAVVSAGWRLTSNASRSSAGGLTTEQGICIPCQLGEQMGRLNKGCTVMRLPDNNSITAWLSCTITLLHHTQVSLASAAQSITVCTYTPRLSLAHLWWCLMHAEVAVATA